VLPQPPIGQWVPHGDAAGAGDVTELSWEHEPPQLAAHTDCEHAVSLGQLQFPAQGDAAGAEDVTVPSWEHEPPQLAPHTDCEHAVSLGQLQFPAQCPELPKAIPIPVNSRTIDTIANFLIQLHLIHFI
jgi:hypothetical protein